MTNEKNIEKRGSEKRKSMSSRSEKFKSKRVHIPVAPVPEVKSLVSDIFSGKWVLLKDYNHVAPQVTQIESIHIYRHIEQQRLQQEQRRLISQLFEEFNDLQKNIAHARAIGALPPRASGALLPSEVGPSIPLTPTISSIPQNFFSAGLRGRSSSTPARSFAQKGEKIFGSAFTKVSNS